MADKLMTATDAKICNIRTISLGPCLIEPDFYRRILATYVALAERTADNARMREGLRLIREGAENRSDEIDALRTQLAEAQADSARINWLDARRENDEAERGGEPVIFDILDREFGTERPSDFLRGMAHSIARSAGEGTPLPTVDEESVEWLRELHRSATARTGVTSTYMAECLAAVEYVAARGPRTGGGE